ncbi:MAG: general secretion pathway protein GspE, partial [Glaciecola sp.]|nr:general secretion pathway protein GspE [Glaciecola sp.]
MLDRHDTLSAAFNELEALLMSIFNVERVYIFQYRKRQQSLTLHFNSTSFAPHIHLPISPTSIAGYVALSKHPLIVSDPYDVKVLSAINPYLRFNDQFDKQCTEITRNILCIPILQQ